MIEVAARLVLAAILLVAAGLKLARPRESAAAMEVYGAKRPALQWTLWGFAVAAETALAIGVALGSRTAAYLAAAMMLLFAVPMVAALIAGRGGQSCACFGPGSRLDWTAVARNIALAAAFLGLTLLPREEKLSTEQWLGLGLVACFAGIVALSVVVLALAREIGMLRLRLPPGSTSALEIPQEGPPLSKRIEWDGWGESDKGLRLAVFLSEGCHICRELEPQVRAFARSPLLEAVVYDERADAAAWKAFSVPGSPYAVACDEEGRALAKGTFNTVAQLESIAATAERRRATWQVNAPQT